MQVSCEAYTREQLKLHGISDPARHWPVQAVAAHWSMKPDTVWRKIRAKKILAIKVGRQWLIPVQSIFRYEWENLNA